jgi:hypothetical protein
MDPFDYTFVGPGLAVRESDAQSAISQGWNRIF